MKCENCGQEIEGLYVKYDGKYFCRHDDDKCLKEYLYDKTDGECEYGTMYGGEEVALSLSEYINFLRLQLFSPGYSAI